MRKNIKYKIIFYMKKCKYIFYMKNYIFYMKKYA